jgi:hypothetical protein
VIHHVRSEELTGEPVRLLSPPLLLPRRDEPVDAERRAQLRALLLEELASDRVVRVARRELARFQGDHVVVHVHPAELALLERSQFVSEFELAALELRGDGALTPGGLRIESSRGQVDATLEQRVERMLTLLWGDRP